MKELKITPVPVTKNDDGDWVFTDPNGNLCCVDHSVPELLAEFTAAKVCAIIRQYGSMAEYEKLKVN